jgi:hypothetical protein
MIFSLESTFAGKEQYRPLCSDLARRVVTAKATFYSSYKHLSKNKRKPASMIKSFYDFPAAINHKTDFNIIKALAASGKKTAHAKSFLDKLKAEEFAIASVENELGSDFYASCTNSMEKIENSCKRLLGKSYKQYEQCLSKMTNTNSPEYANLFPFKNFQLSFKKVVAKN